MIKKGQEVSGIKSLKNYLLKNGANKADADFISRSTLLNIQQGDKLEQAYNKSVKRLNEIKQGSHK